MSLSVEHVLLIIVQKNRRYFRESRKVYLGDMTTCYGGTSETVTASIGSAWVKFRELIGMLVGKQGLLLKQRGKIYQCCVRPVLLYCCKTWELTVVNEARLMCGVRLIEQVSTDLLCDRVGVVVKIEGMTIQSHLWWYGHAMHGNISSQNMWVFGNWNNWEKEEGSTKEIMGSMHKGFGTIWFEIRGCIQSKEMKRAT